MLSTLHPSSGFIPHNCILITFTNYQLQFPLCCTSHKQPFTQPSTIHQPRFHRLVTPNLYLDAVSATSSQIQNYPPSKPKPPLLLHTDLYTFFFSALHGPEFGHTLGNSSRIPILIHSHRHLFAISPRTVRAFLLLYSRRRKRYRNNVRAKIPHAKVLIHVNHTHLSRNLEMCGEIRGGIIRSGSSGLFNRQVLKKLERKLTTQSSFKSLLNRHFTGPSQRRKNNNIAHRNFCF